MAGLRGPQPQQGHDDSADKFSFDETSSRPLISENKAREVIELIKLCFEATEYSDSLVRFLDIRKEIWAFGNSLKLVLGRRKELVMRQRIYRDHAPLGPETAKVLAYVRSREHKLHSISLRSRPFANRSVL